MTILEIGFIAKRYKAIKAVRFEIDFNSNSSDFTFIPTDTTEMFKAEWKEI